MSWTPAAMGSELLQWLKADGITGLSDGDPVTTWSDSSAHGRNVTSSGTARPLYKTTQVNGLPAVAFDGVNDVMSSPSSYALAGQRVAITLVSYLDALQNFQPTVQIHSSSTPTYAAAVCWPGTHYSNGSGYAGGRNQYVDAPVSSFSATTWMIETATTSDQSGTTFRKDGLAFQQGAGSWRSGTITNYSGNAWTHVGDGGAGLAPGRYLFGRIAEIVVYDNSYNDGVWVEGYLAHKYGITLNTGHTFAGTPPTAGPRPTGGSNLFVIED